MSLWLALLLASGPAVAADAPAATAPVGPATPAAAATPSAVPGVAPTPVATAPAEPNPSAGYSFNPLAVKRDPFSIPEDIATEVNDLVRYDLNQINLVAILKGMGPPAALLVLPDGSTHVVHVGDKVGRRNGKISAISTNELTIKESFTDYQKRVKSEITKLVLAD